MVSLCEIAENHEGVSVGFKGFRMFEQKWDKLSLVSLVICADTLDAGIDAGHFPAYLLVNEHLCGLVYVSV